MSVREIPKAFEYDCDACGKRHVQQNASGHYTDSRPAHWIRVIVRRDAHDFQGNAVASANSDSLLCETCGEKVVAAINEAAKQ